MKLAWPLAFRVAVPSRVAPSKKLAVPVGVPAPGATALVVAVRVTGWPNTDGLGEDATVVVVAAWLTTGDTVGEVLPVKLASPPYTAVMERVPTARVEVVKVA